MRLAQLARQLGTTQQEIIKLLLEKGHNLQVHGNTKITEDQLEIVYTHYNYNPQSIDSTENIDLITDNLPDNPTEPELVTHSIPQELSEDIKEKDDELLPEVNQEHVENLSSEEERESVNIEVIRAKKIKLEGIKVLGKIELPEPKQKVQQEQETKTDDTAGSTKLRSTGSKRYSKRGPGKYPKRKLSYEQKLEREQLRAEREKREKEKKIKAKKKQHYYENVQPKTSSKKVKPKKKTESTSTPKERKARPKHKNPVRRLWAWLNGEYD